MSGAEIGKAKSYLYSIAGNIIKNYYKKKKEILLDQLPDIEKDNLTEIETMQQETADALSRIYQKGSLSFSGVKDVRGSLKRLEVGSTLGIGELLAIRSLLENASRAKAYSRRETENEHTDSLDNMFELIEPLSPLATEIGRCILSEDEISDDASTGLRQVRRSMN